MAHFPGGGRAFAQNMPGNQFDIFEWHPKFMSCVRYFVDISQYHGPVQNVAAFVNIQLPFQHPRHPVLGQVAGGLPSPPIPYSTTAGAGKVAGRPEALVSLVPYIRRLVVTGFDNAAVLHGFFGDDWADGVGLVHEQERRNYLFAMKSDSWLRVKQSYDMPDGQVVPFLKPLQNVTEKEIQAAEAHWSEALAMQDWMLGPRSPPRVASRAIKREQDDD